MVSRLQHGGVGGVLVGRGVLRNPWILAQAHDIIEGRAARDVTLSMRGQFLLDYIDLLLREGQDEASGFRHLAPSVGAPATHRPARGRERWVVNKLRALGGWYTQGPRRRVAPARRHQHVGVDRRAARGHPALLLRAGELARAGEPHPRRRRRPANVLRSRRSVSPRDKFKALPAERRGAHHRPELRRGARETAASVRVRGAGPPVGHRQLERREPGRGEEALRRDAPTARWYGSFNVLRTTGTWATAPSAADPGRLCSPGRRDRRPDAVIVPGTARRRPRRRRRSRRRAPRRWRFGTSRRVPCAKGAAGTSSAPRDRRTRSPPSTESPATHPVGTTVRPHASPDDEPSDGGDLAPRDDDGLGEPGAGHFVEARLGAIEHQVRDHYRGFFPGPLGRPPPDGGLPPPGPSRRGGRSVQGLRSPCGRGGRSPPRSPHGLRSPPPPGRHGGAGDRSRACVRLAGAAAGLLRGRPTACAHRHRSRRGGVGDHSRACARLAGAAADRRHDLPTACAHRRRRAVAAGWAIAPGLALALRTRRPVAAAVPPRLALTAAGAFATGWAIAPGLALALRTRRPVASAVSPRLALTAAGGAVAAGRAIAPGLAFALRARRPIAAAISPRLALTAAGAFAAGWAIAPGLAFALRARRPVAAAVSPGLTLTAAGVVAAGWAIAPGLAFALRARRAVAAAVSPGLALTAAAESRGGAGDRSRACARLAGGRPVAATVSPGLALTTAGVFAAGRAIAPGLAFALRARRAVAAAVSPRLALTAAGESSRRGGRSLQGLRSPCGRGGRSPPRSSHGLRSARGLRVAPG